MCVRNLALQGAVEGSDSEFELSEQEVDLAYDGELLDSRQDSPGPLLPREEAVSSQGVEELEAGQSVARQPSNKPESVFSGEEIGQPISPGTGDG